MDQIADAVIAKKAMRAAQLTRTVRLLTSVGRISRSKPGTASGNRPTGPFVSAAATTATAAASVHTSATPTCRVIAADTRENTAAVVNTTCVFSSMLFTAAHVTTDGSTQKNSGSQS